MQLPIRTCAGLALAAALMAGLGGCDNSQSASSGLADTSANTAGPAREDGNPKEVRWQNAIRGLHFETGRLVVDASGPTDRDAAAQSYEAGLQALNRNDPVGAIGSFRDALAAWPEYVDAMRGMGDAMQHKGRTEWAIASYRTYLDRMPDDADVRFVLAMELWGASDAQAAIDEMQTVVELNPQSAAAHERLAIWNYYQADYTQAWHHVHEARALGGDVPPQFVPLLQRQMPDPGRSAG